jgi:hypothetical protein
VQKAIENDELTAAQHEEFQFWPNEERPKIAKAVEQIEALKHFLEGSSGEFDEQAKTQLGDTPDMKRRTFWDDQLW